jgi:hypothetical protein
VADTFTIESRGSGLVVTARECKVTEENLVSDPATAREGRQKTRLLEAVVLSVEDPGPYTHERGGSLDWDKVLHGDREILLKEIRVASWGQDYFRDDNCPSCGDPTENWFDLTKFPVQPLPESSVEHVKTGKPLSCVLPRSKRRVEFRLRRGRDEKELVRIRQYKEGRISSELLKLHVLAVEGIEVSKLADYLGAVDEPDPDFVMGSGDASFLRAKIDEADCGIEHQGSWRCKCGHRWTKDVDFSKDFFFPEYREKTAS